MATVTFDKATRIYPGLDEARRRPARPRRSRTASSSSWSAPPAAASRPRCACSPASRTSTPAASCIGDRDVTHLPPKDRDIAMVFQNYALYPHMTVADNMGFALKIAGDQQGRDPRRASRRPPRSSTSSSTSTASRRRSPVASASASRWAAPSSASRRCSSWTSRCRTSTPSCACRPARQIASLQRRLGVTTVYVTHDQVEAMTMGDRVAVLKDGLLQQVDTPREHVRPPGQRLRRRLHRLPRDEPARAARRRRRRQARRRTSTAVERCGARGHRRAGHPRRPPRGHRARRRGQRPRRSGRRRRGARRRRLRLRHGRRSDGEEPRRSSPASTAASRRRRARPSTSRPSRATCTCSTPRPASASALTEPPESRGTAGPQPGAGPAPFRPRVALVGARPHEPGTVPCRSLRRTRRPGPARPAVARCRSRSGRRRSWSALPRGISRHVVRFVRLGGRASTRSRRSARRSRRARVRPARASSSASTCPCVEPVGVVTGRTTHDGEPLDARAGHPAPAVLAALPRAVLPDAAARHGRPADRRAGRAAGAPAPGRLLLGRLLAVEHPVPPRRRRVRGVPRRRRDRRAARRRSRDGQREYDLDLARTNIAGELLDLEAGGLLHATIDPVDVATRSCDRYQHLWDELTEPRVVRARRALPGRPADPAAQRPRLRRRRADDRHRRRRHARCSSSPRSSTPGTTAAGCCGSPASTSRRTRPAGCSTTSTPTAPASDAQGEDEEIVAHRWLTEVVRAGRPGGARASCAASSSPPRSSTRCSSTAGSCRERAGRDVGLTEARAIRRDVLTHKPDEAAVLGVDTLEMPVVFDD